MAAFGATRVVVVAAAVVAAVTVVVVAVVVVGVGGDVVNRRLSRKFQKSLLPQ